MRELTVYKVENKINKKVYIGATVDFKQRKRQHLCASKKENTNSPLHKDIRLFGKENFEWKIIEICKTLELLYENEEYYIYLYNSFENGYNMNTGKKGYKHTIEQRKNMSDSGKNMSKEKRERINNSLKGRKFSDEGKKRMGKRIWTEDEKKRVSDKMKNRIISDETKKKLSEINKGKKLSEEHKKKISDTKIKQSLAKK